MHTTPSRIRPALPGQIIRRLDTTGTVLRRYRVATIGSLVAWLEAERDGNWEPSFGMALRPGDVLDLACRDGMVVGTFHFEDVE